MQNEYLGASADAIGHHYDLSNDFFKLWLDDSLTYSCALWDGSSDTLEAAQVRKLDYMIDEAAVSGGSSVLDIGCGWGSLIDRLSSRGVDRVTGLTLSKKQASWIESKASQAAVHVENWADHQGDGAYDSIISIGAFEHFANYGLPRPERVEAYRRFFKWARNALNTSGRLSLQTNAKGNNVGLDRRTVNELRFICTTIFPESELPWLSEIVEASERLFHVKKLRNDAGHYARTCAEWHRRLQENHQLATEVVGEEAVADYERYLSSTVRHFEQEHLALLRITFEKA